MAQSEHAGAEQCGATRRSDQAGSLFVHINSFVPGNFGEAHYHPTTATSWSIDGAAWRGTGNVVDPAHATRVPKGTFMIDAAGKVHWDGTKDEGGAYFIIETRPAGRTAVPKEQATGTAAIRRRRRSCSRTRFRGKAPRADQRALLAGDPSKPGIYVMMSQWPKGNTFSHPHFHTNDRYVYVLDGTWWVATGNKFDPANLMIPVKAGTFATEFGKQVHWAGAKDEDATILIFGEGPTTNTAVEEAK